MHTMPLSQAELLLWTAVLGAFGPLFLSSAVEFAQSRARWALEVALYLLSAAAFVAVMSGFLAHVWRGAAPLMFALAPGVVTSISVALGVMGVRNWLGTKKRERFADVTLKIAIIACLVCLVLVLIFEPMVPTDHLAAGVVLQRPATWVTPLAFLVGICGFMVTSFATLRVALHGDRRAWEMFATCVLTAGVTVGLVLRNLLDWRLPVEWLAVAAGCYLFGVLLLGRAAWRRGRKFVHVARMLDADSGRDPITRLLMGSSMISAMDRSYSASLRLTHRPVVIVVQLFNGDEIVKDCGESGLNQVILATLGRIRKILSPADMIGRYYGTCFAIQINGRVTPQYLRGLGLRLAASTRRPVVPRLPPSGFEDNEPIETDVGVGICWCDRLDDLTMALGEAELAAVAARAFRSRAAVKLGPDLEAAAVEKALGEGKLEIGFLDSASAKMKGLPGRLLGKRGAAGVVRKVAKRVGKAAIGQEDRPNPAKVAHKPSSRGAGRRSIGSGRAGQETRF